MILDSVFVYLVDYADQIECAAELFDVPFPYRLDKLP